MIKKSNITFIFCIAVMAVFLMANTYTTENNSKKENTEVTKETNPMPSEEAFDKMMQVLTHKRCVNCHPSGDRPRQGEDSHYHNFGVMRGDKNHGAAALQCESCHAQENNDFSGVPGAPEWSLAPIEMAWEGLSRVEIAKSMLNPENNGGRDLEHIVEHLTEHALVLWGEASGSERGIY